MSGVRSMELEMLVTALASGLHDLKDRGIVFTLVLCDIGPSGVMTYASNGHRSDVVKMLGDLAGKIDAEDIADRKRIGAEREGLRAAAMEEQSRKASERLKWELAQCGNCKHSRRSHEYYEEQCDGSDDDGITTECACGAFIEPAIDATPRAAYEAPAIEKTETIEPGHACRECGSTIGFCHPSCQTQGRD